VNADPTTTDVPALMTSEEVAALFRVTINTVTRWARAGKFGRTLRPGGRDYRFYKHHVTHAYLGGTFDQEGNPQL
jgi:excisionase family DNA binding protein